MIFPAYVRRASMIISASLAAAALGFLPVITSPAEAAPTASSTPAADRPNAQMGWKSRQQEQEKGIHASFTPTGVLGMDVSSYQGKVNWKRWAARGKSFVFVKATEGTSYKNPYFAAQYGGSYDAGMMHGAYHFANPAGKSGIKQARYFVANGGAWSGDGRTLPGVLDIEYNPYGSTCYGISKKKMITFITDFTVEYKRLTTRDAIIYSTADWWNQCTGNTTKFSLTNPLWAARYGTKNPGKLPGSWTVATFWQYTSTPLDQDQFSSTPDRLTVLATGVEPKKK